MNRWVDCSTGTFYHPADVYAQNVDAWNGTRIVFNPSDFAWELHPDAKLYAADPETALQDVGAIDIGYIDNAQIVWEGHPRLVAAMHIDNNNAYGKMALDLYSAGTFGISIADIFNASEGVVTGGIEPNHVLVFEENGWNMPADKGAVAAASSNRVSCFTIPDGPKNRTHTRRPLVNPAPVAANSANDVESIVSKVFEKIKGFLSTGSIEVQSSASNSEQPSKKMAETPESPEPKLAALNQQIGALEKDKTDLNTKLETVTAQLTDLKATSDKQAAELEGLKKEKADQEAAKQEAAFTEFLNDVVPDGEKGTEEQKAALHTMFFEDPLTLAQKTRQWAMNAAALPGKVGSRQVSANTGGDHKSADWAGLFHKGGNRS